MTPGQLQAKMKQLAAEMEYTESDMRAYAQIAADERRKGIMAGMAVDGSKFAPLKAATIRQKSGASKARSTSKKSVRKSLSPPTALVATGAFMNPTTSSTKREGRVNLAKSRAKNVSSAGSISEIHDKGSGNIPQRHHWGIYAKARTRIQAFHKARFRRICRSIFSGIR